MRLCFARAISGRQRRGTGHSPLGLGYWHGGRGDGHAPCGILQTSSLCPASWPPPTPRWAAIPSSRGVWGEPRAPVAGYPPHRPLQCPASRMAMHHRSAFLGHMEASGLHGTVAAPGTVWHPTPTVGKHRAQRAWDCRRCGWAPVFGGDALRQFSWANEHWGEWCCNSNGHPRSPPPNSPPHQTRIWGSGKMGKMGGNGGKWGRMGAYACACACAYVSPLAEGGGLPAPLVFSLSVHPGPRTHAPIVGLQLTHPLMTVVFYSHLFTNLAWLLLLHLTLTMGMGGNGEVEGIAHGMGVVEGCGGMRLRKPGQKNATKMGRTMGGKMGRNTHFSQSHLPHFPGHRTHRWKNGNHSPTLTAPVTSADAHGKILTA